MVVFKASTGMVNLLENQGQISMSMTAMMRTVLENVFSNTTASNPTQKMMAPSVDGLTGLLTREGLRRAAYKVLTRAGNRPRGYAAITLDLDYFKQINDTIGHKAGDLVLKQVAHRMRGAVRAEDLIARIGGDEFVILMPDVISEITVLNIADRVLTAVSQPIVDDSIQLFPSLTAGISMSSETEDANFEEILHRSDLALHQAKLVCRGTVHFFDRNMAGELNQRKQIEQDLRRAATNNELRLHYQPIYDIKHSIISHVEALVRWQHPKFGLVQPADFIPAAEATGLINSIGIWVLRQAFEDLEKFNAYGFKDIGVSVNLSPEQLKLTSIVNSIEEMGRIYPEHHGRVILEVTEEAVVDERYQMTCKLENLRDAGFKVFLDDFGTGNASIGRLRKFSFDAIKIDRSLITNLEQNKADLAIVRSILLLADSLGVTVIAEGVETAACLNILVNENCRYAQGYYFSKPLPLNETVQAITQRFETSNLAQALSSD